jgi:hypothetical protein
MKALLFLLLAIVALIVPLFVVSLITEVKIWGAIIFIVWLFMLIKLEKMFGKSGICGKREEN